MTCRKTSSSKQRSGYAATGQSTWQACLVRLSDLLLLQAIGNRGYTGLGEQILDKSGKQKKGDTKESYYICSKALPALSLFLTLKQPLTSLKIALLTCATALPAAPEAPEGSERAKLPFHGPNRWPAAAPGFKPAMESYMSHMDTVYRRCAFSLATSSGCQYPGCRTITTAISVSFQFS